MTIGILKEPAHETRVSLLAEAVATLTKKGITVILNANQIKNVENNKIDINILSI